MACGQSARNSGGQAKRSRKLRSFSNKHVLAETEYQDEKGLYDYNDLSFSYGLSLYNNNHFRSTIIEEGYVKLEYKNWSLRAGRFEENQNDPARDLSSGNLGISDNALPIPKVGIAITDYTRSHLPMAGFNLRDHLRMAG